MMGAVVSVKLGTRVSSPLVLPEFNTHRPDLTNIYHLSAILTTLSPDIFSRKTRIQEVRPGL